MWPLAEAICVHLGRPAILATGPLLEDLCAAANLGLENAEVLSVGQVSELRVAAAVLSMRNG